MSRYSTPTTPSAKAGAVVPSVAASAAKTAPKRKRSAPVKGTPRLLSTAQAADYLGVSPNTIRKYRDEGKIPAFLVGERLVKYAPEDLDRFLRRMDGE